MQPALTPGQAAALRLDTVERTAGGLTRKQADGLRRVRDRGPYAWCEGRGRAGGAISRMFARMVPLGLVNSPPHEITVFGIKVLDAYDRR